MKHYSEGELRAWLDRELPAMECDEIAAHLRDCNACDMTRETLAVRSTRVMASLIDLPIVAGAPRRVELLEPQGWFSLNWRWLAPAIAMAACLAVALMVLPVRG